MSVFPHDFKVDYRAAQVGSAWAVFADRWWFNDQGDKEYDVDTIAEGLTQSVAEATVETLRQARKEYLEARSRAADQRYAKYRFRRRG